MNQETTINESKTKDQEPRLKDKRQDDNQYSRSQEAQQLVPSGWRNSDHRVGVD